MLYQRPAVPVMAAGNGIHSPGISCKMPICTKLHNGITPYSPMEKFFATCPRGLEQLLAEELQQLTAKNIHTVGGGVHFSGEFSLCYRTNLESRIASRVLWQVTRRRYRDEDDIYATA